MKYYTYTLQLRIDFNTNKLLLASVCDNFCQLFNITPFQIGECIDDLFEEKMTRHLYSISDYFRTNKQPLTQLSERCGNFYIVRAVCSNSFIHIRAEYTDISRINNIYCKYIDSFGNTADRYDSCILAEKQENGFAVSSISEDISEITGLKTGEYISPKNLFHLQTCNILDECLKSNSVIKFIDIFDNNEIRQNILLTLIPMNHNIRRVIIIINNISENMYFNYQSAYAEHGHSILNAVSVKNAAAVYLCSEQTKIPHILEANDLFRELLSDKLSNFIKQSVLNTVSSNHIAIKKVIEDDNRYIITVIPYSFLSRVIVIVSQDEGFAEAYKCISQKLTRRENNVAEYLFRGESFKCIASNLKIAPGTVKKISSNIYKKFGVQSRAEFMNLCFSYEYIYI